MSDQQLNANGSLEDELSPSMALSSSKDSLKSSGCSSSYVFSDSDQLSHGEAFSKRHPTRGSSRLASIDSTFTIDSSISRSTSSSYSSFSIPLYLKVGRLRQLSETINSDYFLLKHGSPTCISRSENHFAIGTSLGKVFLNFLQLDKNVVLNVKDFEKDISCLPVSCVCLSTELNLLCQANVDGSIFIWDIAQPEAKLIFSFPSDASSLGNAISQMALVHSAETTLAVLNSQGRITLYDFYDLILNKTFSVRNVQLDILTNERATSLSSISFKKPFLSLIKNEPYFVVQTLRGLCFFHPTKVEESNYTCYYSKKDATIAAHVVRLIPRKANIARLVFSYDSTVEVHQLQLKNGLNAKFRRRCTLPSNVCQLEALSDVSVILAFTLSKEIYVLDARTLVIISIHSLSSLRLMAWDWMTSIFTEFTGLTHANLSTSVVTSSKVAYLLGTNGIYAAFPQKLQGQYYVSQQLGKSFPLFYELCNYYKSHSYLQNEVNSSDVYDNLLLGVLLQHVSSQLSNYTKTDNHATNLLDLLQDVLEKAHSNNLFSEFCVALLNSVTDEMFYDECLNSISAFVVSYQISDISIDLQTIVFRQLREKDRMHELEQFICSLNFVHMNFDAVFTLSRDLELFDAYSYLCIYALHDYSSPLLQFLKYIKEDAHSDDYEEKVHKGFQFLSFSLTGLKYPLGTAMEERDSYPIAHTLLKCLFSCNVLPIHVDVNDKETFPYVRLLLKRRKKELYSMLDGAFESSYFNQANVSVAKQQSPIVSRQWILESLLDIEKNDDNCDYLYILLANSLAKYPQFLLFPTSLMEQCFFKLCQSSDLSTKFARIEAAEALFTVFTPIDVKRISSSCKDNKLYSLVEKLAFSVCDFSSALSALVSRFEDGDLERELWLGQQELFQKIEHWFQVLVNIPEQYQELQRVVIANSAVLSTIDVPAFADLIIHYAPTEMSSVLRELERGDCDKTPFVEQIMHLDPNYKFADTLNSKDILAILTHIHKLHGDMKVLSVLQEYPEFTKAEGLTESLKQTNSFESLIHVSRLHGNVREALDFIIQCVRHLLDNSQLDAAELDGIQQKLRTATHILDELFSARQLTERQTLEYRTHLLSLIISIHAVFEKLQDKRFVFESLVSLFFDGIRHSICFGKMNDEASWNVVNGVLSNTLTWVQDGHDECRNPWQEMLSFLLRSFKLGARTKQTFQRAFNAQKLQRVYELRKMKACGLLLQPPAIPLHANKNKAIKELEGVRLYLFQCGHCSIANVANLSNEEAPKCPSCTQEEDHPKMSEA
ncbi:WD repeat protein Vps8 [Schizosaccharomyces japonicus yFS275]|uniref:WD repeat protein Vps8 n=1 Tax=Schizosaccharomyces japonicus (strain yFS275 / FY16936) TaxID=402676 RepID=B6JV04_SCHJY|nr:WD repeat protein Vps8 [Schizosaccharomyces japonicus yFS275]EEB05205.1 WD repeat protein Vps8 [Schizosaccharomyces japonicus yFS275]